MASLTKFFKNPFYTFVLGIVFSIVIATCFFFLALTPKRLEVVQISEVPVLNIENIKDDIEVVYKGESIENPYLYTYRVNNVGKKEIMPDDFSDSLKFVFNEDLEIMDYSISECESHDLELDVRMNTNYLDSVLSIDGILLNPKDSFLISIMTNEQAKRQKISTRIAGLNRLITKDKKLDSILVSGISAIITTLLLSFFQLLLKKRLKTNEKEKV